MEKKEHMNQNTQLALAKIADNNHEIYALLKQRYSPRIFSDKEVSENDMNRLFEAVRWSASSNNLQPWRFIYAHKGTEGYDNIMKCLDKFNQDWAINAPVLLLAGYKENKDNGDENFHALHDLGLFRHMTVQAQYMDIGTHQMAGINFEKAKKEFGFPEEYHV
ncbi:hypothetical protein LCGC14_2485730, partial [marine sediment metagenome]